MRARFAVHLSLGGLLLIIPALTQAGQLGQANTPAGSSFASACAGYAIFSGIGDPGLGYNYQGNGASGPGYNCSNDTSASGAFATAALAGTYHIGFLNQDIPFDSSATSSASIGSLHVQSSNASEPAVEFPGGAGNAGWNDNITINTLYDANGNPISNPGQTGLWVFPVVVDGTLSQSGNASATFLVAPYLNQTQIGGDYFPGHPAIDDTALNMYNTMNVTHNGTVGSTWDFEMSEWQVSGTLTSMTVDSEVWMVVPFVFGTQFELGVYISDLSSETGFGLDLTPGTSSVDFSHTLSWGGPGYVIDGTQTSSNFTVNSQSGFNYNQSLTPEPSTWSALVAGLGLILAAKRRGFRRG